ncbi:MAG: efflux RND transporter periplasmic adaptor subunit, partial [Planctomycetota bacterium]
EPLYHDGATEDLPPQIEEALENYVDESYGRNIAVLPLREPQRKLGAEEETGAAGEIDKDDAHRGEVIGALIIEQVETDIPGEIFRQRCDLVYEHGTRAIANSQSHSNLFLMPVWRTLGRATWILRARTLPKTVGVVALLLIAIFALTFIQKDFDLSAEGTLEPTVRRQVFAPIDGEVIEVRVQRNSIVQQGDILVQLKNSDIDIALEELYGQLRSSRAEFSKIKSQQLKKGQFEPSEMMALQAQESELDTKILALEAKLRLQLERKDQLTIRAPISGVVTTWDVEDSLRSRPITTGQVLLEVADLDEPFSLKLKLPEKREGHLDRFIKDNGNPESLEVTYILETDPTMDPLDATLKLDAISRRAEPHEEHGAVIEMEALPDEKTLRELSPAPGASVLAQVRCGRRASGFVFFHEIYEWLCKFFF